MRHMATAAVLVTIWTLGFAEPALAQRQAVAFNLGYFGLERDGLRSPDDVLFQDQADLLFEIRDFDSVTVGGEYLVALTEFIEAGVGVNYYQRTVPTIYADLLGDDGAEIEQDLKLRIIPVTATVRFVPFGVLNNVQPYIGGGIGVYRWRYSESGEFVDFADFSVFEDTFVAEDTNIGGVIVGGIRAAVTPELFLGGEFRYNIATGQTGGLDNGFLGDEIELGGFNALVTFTVKF